LEKNDITPELVRALVAERFPQWSHLAVEPVELDGWDNTTFRLGEKLSVRLPSGDDYVPQVRKEHQWLPVLAPHLPLPIPEPLAVAEPSSRFGRPWSVYRWIPGAHATIERVPDRTQFALDLADFLDSLYGIDASDGPRASWEHSAFRGCPLSVWDAHTRAVVADLEPEVDARNCRAVWSRALATAWDKPPVWFHGDTTASNLLVRDGRLRAVIDFGCAAVGDPACDLVIAWTFFEGDSRRAFRDRIYMDDDTWARARGWALWKALITQHEGVRSGDVDDTGARFGWRVDALSLIRELCTDE
jgi:aminoglycoside phosphotransferase (APT) family kinase protein